MVGWYVFLVLDIMFVLRLTWLRRVDCPLFKLGPHDGRPMRPYLGPEWAAEWDEADGEGEIERGIGDLKIDS
jgi:hypothetical protein